MLKKILPLALLSALAGAAALVTARGGRSRESLLPVLRAIQGEEKTAERFAGKALPVGVDEELQAGREFDRAMPRDTDTDPRRRTLEARVAELGGELGRSSINRRFRGRYAFRLVQGHGSANAFSVAGGFVYVTVELARRFERDEDALRFVLGHEIGHVELGHGADEERLKIWSRKAGVEPAGDLASLLRRVAALHYSEVQELEADQYALRLLGERRRPLRAALRAMDLLGVTDQKERPALPDPVGIAVEGILDYPRTHPGGWERRAALQRTIGG